MLFLAQIEREKKIEIVSVSKIRKLIVSMLILQANQRTRAAQLVKAAKAMTAAAP